MSTETLIRERGAVLDMPFTKSIYGPLLEHQPREGVAVTFDVAYGSDPRQRLDVYRPETSATAGLPALLFLPGGGFIRGDKDERANFGFYFAQRGYVVVVANYRLGPAHRWPAGAEDVIGAYRWLHANAAQFGIDSDHVVIGGESAGAAHVALATMAKRFHPTGGLRVAGTILISGVYDVHLEKLARSQFGTATPDPRNEAYFGSDFDAYPGMSTIDLVDAPPLPLFISFAELDLLQMQVQAGELFARLVTRHGYAPTLKVIGGHNHLTQVYSVNTGDESLSAPVLEFLRGLSS